MTASMHSLVIFALLCLVSTLSGVGILSVLGLRLRPALRWLLAPGTCLVAWTLTLGISVPLGVTVSQAALPFWIVTAAMGLIGVWRSRRTLTRDAVWPLLVVMALPVALMVFDFYHGLQNFVGGPTPDGWSYVARGQQLWEMRHDAQGQFAPLYEYGSHLKGTRFITSALLAIFSPLTGRAGDTQAAAGYFIAWSLFVFGASCAAVAAANEMRRWWLLAFCILAVTSRWIVGAVEVHNYDNLIAISLLPLAFGAVTALETVDWRAAAWLGGFLAAALYIYPEAATLVIMGTGLTVLKRAIADRRLLTWIAVGAASAVVGVLLLLPVWTDLATFLSRQAGAATSAVGTRIGESVFVELLNLRNWTAVSWGLDSTPGAVRAGIGRDAIEHAIGAALWLMAAVGCVRLARQRRWDVAVLGLVMVGGTLFMIGHEHYSYGAYKFLLLGAWLVAWFVVAGAEALVGAVTVRQSIDPRIRVLAAAAVALPLVALPISLAERIVVFRQGLPAPSMETFRVVEGITRVIGAAPIAVQVNDGLANQWAVYFLRRQPMRLLQYRSYMAFAHVTPLMDRATPVDLQTIKYVLSDEPQAPQETAVWSGGPYTLWRLPPTGTAFLRQVTNPNGNEQVSGQSFYWVGGADTIFNVFATADGRAALSSHLVRGPSMPDQRDRHLLIGTTTGGDQPVPVTVTADGEQSFEVPVHAGENHVFIRSLDKPTVPNIRGDTRPLMLGLMGLHVSLLPIEVRGDCGVEFISGWYGRETTPSGWFSWSDGNSRLSITTRQSADFVLTGNLQSYIRPNAVTVFMNDRQVARWSVDDPTFGFHPVTPLALHIDAGKPATIRFVSQAAAVRPPSDARPLAIAIENLTLRQRDGVATCAVNADAPAPSGTGGRGRGSDRP